MNNAERTALLEQLLNDQPQPEQPSFAETQPAPPVVPASPTVKRVKTPKSTSPGFYDKSMDSIAYSAGLAVAFGLWLTGAYFTLQFLAGIGINLAGLSWGQWLIPIAITACELRLWPGTASTWQRWLLWFCVLMFDIGTSFAGMAQVAAGKTFDFFNGITIPSGGAGLWIIASVMAVAFAFIPEKLARWAGAELHAVWR